jgi:ABC-type nitrate/sulfonate/bicarbonate transport system substrate-binding protein
MRNALSAVCLAVIALVIGGASTPAFATDPRKEVRLDYADYSPVSLVVRKFGWIEAALAAEGVAVQWRRSENGEQALAALSSASIDFGSAGDVAAMRARAGGDPIKAVYVYGGAQVDGYGLLSVREGFAAAHPAVVGHVLKTYDRARKWIVAHPAEAAQVVAGEAKLSVDEARARLDQMDFTASAPGPAQVAAIKVALSRLVADGAPDLKLDATQRIEDLIDRATARAALSSVSTALRTCGNFCDHW